MNGAAEAEIAFWDAHMYIFSAQQKCIIIEEVDSRQLEEWQEEKILNRAGCTGIKNKRRM